MKFVKISWRENYVYCIQDELSNTEALFYIPQKLYIYALYGSVIM